MDERISEIITKYVDGLISEEEMKIFLEEHPELRD